MRHLAVLLSAAMTLAACGGSGGSTNPAASSSFDFAGATAVPVGDCPAATGKDAQWCRNNWPRDVDGTVYQYAFTETRLVSGQRFGRLAYVYKPATIVAGTSYPLLTYLHGGTQAGEELFAQLPFAQLADGRSIDTPITWPRNSASCQEGPLGAAAFGLGGAPRLGFIRTDGSGEPCDPDMQTYARPATAPPFYVVYPDGIFDFNGGGRSWEDGRTPSPGQLGSADPQAQHRDDVGFIDALIATVKLQEGAQVDTTRVYVGGLSNGGLMTTRLLCNLNNAAYPELASVAAFSVSVAAMADNLASGSNDVEQCARSGHVSAPLAIFVGYDSPTPNSDGQPFFANCNPYNPTDPVFPNQPACPYPTVSGDGTMPYGTAFETGGGSFTVNSLTIGKVIASLDNQNFWLDYLTGSGAGNSSLNGGMLGYFTHYKRYTFADSPLVYQVFETQNGLHLNAGTRFDFSSAARIYDFLFAFRKVNGATVRVGGAFDPESLTYGNLDGIY